MNKMRLFISFPLVICLLVLLISGCGSVKTSSYFNEPQVKLNNYAGLEISDFETKIPYLPKDALTQIPDETARLLTSENTGFGKVGRGPLKDIPGESTLVLLGEVTEYQSGKNIKFEGGAIKFGEASLTVQLAIVEKETGKEVVTGEVNGFSSLGFTKSGIYKGVAEEIVKFVSENY
jgi:hypothetical protein